MPKINTSQLITNTSLFIYQNNIGCDKFPDSSTGPYPTTNGEQT